MTGFGAARTAVHSGGLELHLEVEIRSVNHRHLKVSTRVSEALSGLVPRLDELTRKRLARGVVYINVRLSGGAAAAWQLDRDLLVRLHGELAEVALTLDVDPPPLGEVARLPGVVREEETHLTADEVWPALSGAAGEALEALDAARRREGEGIGAQLGELAGEMLTLADRVAAAAPLAVEEQARRLRERVAQLVDESVSLDPAGLQREIALVADKSDITEELQRLRSHAGQLRAILAAPPAKPVGRKLEFLTQELMREANTMANKSHDTDLIDTILSIKLCVERVREQVANLE